MLESHSDANDAMMVADKNKTENITTKPIFDHMLSLARFALNQTNGVMVEEHVFNVFLFIFFILRNSEILKR